jgi:hypothetical protein
MSYPLSLLLFSISVSMTTAAPIASTTTLNCLDFAPDLVGFPGLGVTTRRDDGTSGTMIDGSAGTYIDPAAAGAIAGGAVGVLLLVVLICWCGRRRNW